MNLIVNGLDIVGPGAGTPGSGCVLITNCAGVHLKNSTFTSANYGICGRGCLISTFENLTIQDNVAGADMRENDGFNPNLLTWRECRFVKNWASTYYSQKFNNSIQNFYDCQFEENNIVAGQIGDGNMTMNFNNDAGTINVNGCHFESNIGSNCIYYNGYNKNNTITIMGCFFINPNCTNTVNVYQ